MLYALRGLLAASVGRFAVREYRDSHDGIKRRDGTLNGLYGGFSFWVCSALLDAGAKCRLRAVGRRTSGGKLVGSIGTRADTLEGI